MYMYVLYVYVATQKQAEYVLSSDKRAILQEEQGQWIQDTIAAKDDEISRLKSQLMEGSIGKTQALLIVANTLLIHCSFLTCIAL